MRRDIEKLSYLLPIINADEYWNLFFSTMEPSKVSPWVLNQQEEQALKLLQVSTKELFENGFPYEETVLMTARYTLIITLLHQRQNHQLISTPKYRGAPNLRIEDVLKDDLFTNNDYFNQAGESLLTAMLCLPKWLADPDIMLYPEHDVLSKKDFIQVSPFPFYMLGVCRNPVVEADDEPMSPGGFLGHDLDHTGYMLASWKEDVAVVTGSDSDLKIENVIQKRIQVRNRSVALFTVLEGEEIEALTDTLFDLTHEYGRSPLTQRHIHFYDHYHPWLDSLHLSHKNKTRICVHRFFKWLDYHHRHDSELETLKCYARDYLLADQHVVEEKLRRITGWGKVCAAVRGNRKLCRTLLQKYCDLYNVDPMLVEEACPTDGIAPCSFALWLDRVAFRQWFIEVFWKNHRELLPSADSLPPEFSRLDSPFHSGGKEQTAL